MPPKVTSRKTDFTEKVAKKPESSSGSAEDPRLTLQQVRVALQKIPVAQMRSRRRRHSMAEDEAVADKKKVLFPHNVLEYTHTQIIFYKGHCGIPYRTVP